MGEEGTGVEERKWEIERVDWWWVNVGVGIGSVEVVWEVGEVIWCVL